MICVSIGRSRAPAHDGASIGTWSNRAPTLVELRLDYINGEVNIKRLLADRPCPVVITCRREQRRRQVDRQRGAAADAACGRRSPRASSTSTWRTTSPGRSRASARRSGSSASTTSARRPTISRRSTAGSASSTPTSSRSARWPTIRTTTCACCGWSARARCRRSACAWATSACPRGSSPASSARRSPTPRSTTSGRWPRGNSASSR